MRVGTMFDAFPHGLPPAQIACGLVAGCTQPIQSLNPLTEP